MSVVNRRTVLIALVTLLVVIGGVVYSVGKKDDNKTANEQTTSEQTHDHSEHEHNEVAGTNTTDTTESTDQTQTTDDTTTETTPVTTASTSNKKTATTTQTTTPAVTTPTTPETPQDNPTTPVEEPTEQPEEEPEEVADVVFVPVGGSTETFRLEMEDGSSVNWYAACPFSWNDETLPEEKPLADMYMVLDVPETDAIVGPSVDFHINAQDFAVPGDQFECGFFIEDPETGEGYMYTFLVVITEDYDFEVL